MGIAATAAPARDHLVEGAGQAMAGLAPSAAIPQQGSAAVAQAIQTHLQTGELAAAVQLALAARQTWALSPRLAELAILAFGRAGVRELAADAARATGLNAARSMRFAAVAADAFIKAGHPSEAIVVLEAADTRAGTDSRAWYELARARQRLGDRPAETLADALKALALAPDCLRVIELAARLHLDCGQPEAAVTLLADLPESRKNTSICILLVEAYSALKTFAPAVTYARRLAADHLASQPMMRRLSAALLQMGEASLAQELYQESLAIRRKGLPERLADGVMDQAALHRRAGGTLPLQRLDWLWQKLVAHDRAPADRAAWTAELTTVAGIDRLFLDWIECRPDAAEDLSRLITGVGPARDMVAAALMPGKGAFIAAAHVGLLFGGLAALAQSNLPMAFVSSIPKLGHLAQETSLISTTTEDKRSVARALARALRAGKVATVVIDGAPERGGTTYPLFDRQITLSDFIPRHSWKSGAASFFPAVIWEDQQARLTLSALPGPTGFSTVQAYVDAWMRAYLDRLETLLLDHPVSARASGGFWANIML